MTTLITAAKGTTTELDRGSLQILINDIIILRESPLQASSNPIPRVIKWPIVITWSYALP